MCAGDFGAGDFDFFVGRGGEFFVEGESDGLDGDVGRTRGFEEGAEDAGGDVAAAADGDDEVGFEGGENAGRGVLAEFMDLVRRD